MKLPKTIILCGRTYQIIKDKTFIGGKFYCGGQKILIGIKDKPCSDEIRIRLLHEIVECILAERTLRYRLDYTEIENGHYLFVFNHKQFEDWIIDLAGTLKDMIK